MERWVGKVALVTGASAGIGAAVVAEFAKQGLKVVGLARREERVEELKKQLGKVKGEVHALKGDISKEEDILATFKWIKEKFGTIHVLVNNAGVMKVGTLAEGSIEQFRTTLETNVLGLTICTQQALKLMKESGVDDGHIFHINSLAGHRIPNLKPPIFNVYPASKYAVTALTESLRQELVFNQSKIRVTSVSPGPVKTEFLEASLKGRPEAAMLKQFEASLNFLEAQDVADAVVFALGMPARAQIHEIMLRPVSHPH